MADSFPSVHPAAFGLCAGEHLKPGVFVGIYIGNIQRALETPLKHQMETHGLGTRGLRELEGTKGTQKRK